MICDVAPSGNDRSRSRVWLCWLGLSAMPAAGSQRAPGPSCSSPGASASGYPDRPSSRGSRAVRRDRGRRRPSLPGDDGDTAPQWFCQRAWGRVLLAKGGETDGRATRPVTCGQPASALGFSRLLFLAASQCSALIALPPTLHSRPRLLGLLGWVLSPSVLWGACVLGQLGPERAGGEQSPERAAGGKHN